MPDLSGMAAVPDQSPEKPSLTHAPKRANPHPDEANTRAAEDDLSTSTAKVGEASVESSNLLQVAQAANLALEAAMQALSLEPDQGAPCPMRVEQFEMRDEGKPPRGRGRGKGRGKGTGRGKGGNTSLFGSINILDSKFPSNKSPALISRNAGDLSPQRWSSRSTGSAFLCRHLQHESRSNGSRSSLKNATLKHNEDLYLT